MTLAATDFRYRDRAPIGFMSTAFSLWWAIEPAVSLLRYQQITEIYWPSDMRRFSLAFHDEVQSNLRK